MLTVVPQTIDNNVKRLMNRIKVTEKPIYLDVVPEPYAEESQCFPAVDRKIEEDGGSVQLGWQIWLIPKIIIEAEFHAVWKSPEGELKDITPKPERRILFVSDLKAKYDNARRSNIRLNISRNKLVNDLIQVLKALDKLQNKGERASTRQIIYSVEESRIFRNLAAYSDLCFRMIKRDLSRNSLCICKSGHKYKHCCGKRLSVFLSMEE